MNVAIAKIIPGSAFPDPLKPQPDSDMLEAIENIKSTLRIQVKNGNLDAAFLLRRMR